MKQIKEYQVVKATDMDELERSVNAALKQGWVPTGGIFSVNFTQARPQPAVVMLQAMVRYED